MIFANVPLRPGVKPEFAPMSIAVTGCTNMGCPDVAADRRAPAETPSPSLPVCLFGVQEEPLVETTDLGKCFATKHKHRADRKSLAAPQSSKADRLNPRAERGWKRPAYALIDR
jgi:hypothetical protein